MRHTLPACLFLSLAAGCAPQRVDVEIREVRERVVPAPRLHASSDERFGADEAGAAHGHAGLGGAEHGGPGNGAGNGGAHNGSAAGFVYDLPEGWLARPPAPMRDVDLRTADGVEVWVSRLAGDGGGPLANLNRWRLQLGLAPVDADALDRLPRAPLLDGSAYRVDLRAGDGATRLVGLMLFRPGSAVFARMSGPPELVERSQPDFARFAASLRERAGHAAGAAADGPAADASGLAWSAPPTWFALAAGPFRTAHFRVAPGVEAWLSVLEGDAGGLEANVARWCEQLGRPPLDAAAFAALPRIDVLGRSALWVDLTADDGGRGIAGALCALDDRTVFVKMDGPSAAVRAHVDELRAFCGSLARKEGP